jgi:cell division protein FtsW (lipid II flippase)
MTICTQNPTFLYFYQYFLPTYAVRNCAGDAKGLVAGLYVVELQNPPVVIRAGATTFISQIFTYLLVPNCLYAVFPDSGPITVCLAVFCVMFFFKTFTLKFVAVFALRVQLTSQTAL